jgi:uncharacterized radical SAM superfamily Fe-S cluster-containing enzyme
MPAETFLNSTLTYCTDCGQTELARVMVRDGSVFMDRSCANGDRHSTKIVDDYRWYLERQQPPGPIAQAGKVRPAQSGCPLDCGLCEFHTSDIHLPVFSITNACNLDCPICFTFNRPDEKYYKSVSDMRKIVQHILAQTSGVDLVNITGGEPTLHPQLFDIIQACDCEQIGRVTLNSNGLRLASSRRFAEKIKEAGVQVVLSLDTFDPEKSKVIHGADISEKKRLALQVLEELDIPTTILSVCIKNVNEADVEEIVHMMIRKPFVRSITIQNMTFTGQNGSQFENGPANQPRQHITIDEIERLLAARGEILQDDFFPLGSYHPLCYSVAYYIVYEERLLSLSRLIDKSLLTEASRGSYLLDPDRRLSTRFLEGINRLWAEGEDEAFIRVLRRFFDELYPRDRHLSPRQRHLIAEKLIKPIYIHPHMDADNFDIDRVSRCGDVVPDESGRMIPACAYNLVHRQRDPRFWVE